MSVCLTHTKPICPVTNFFKQSYDSPSFVTRFVSTFYSSFIFMQLNMELHAMDEHWIFLNLCLWFQHPIAQKWVHCYPVQENQNSVSFCSESCFLETKWLMSYQQTKLCNEAHGLWWFSTILKPALYVCEFFTVEKFKVAFIWFREQNLPGKMHLLHPNKILLF